MTSLSQEFQRAIKEAQDIAKGAGESLNTAHLLLSFFTFPNRAQIILKERQITEDTILEKMPDLPQEPKDTIQRLKQRAIEIAKGSDSPEVDCLHLLITLLRVRESVAYELLERTGIPITHLRNVVVSYVTNELPKRLSHIQKEEPLNQPLQSLKQIKKEHRQLITPQGVSATPQDIIDQIQPDMPVSFIDKTPLSRPSKAPTPNNDKKPTPTTTVSKHPFALDQKDYPLLCEIGRNLVYEAYLGKIDDLIGRKKELSQVIDVLGRRRANNPCLIGAAGVGKTAIVEGIAYEISKKSEDVCHLHDKLIIEIPVSAIVAGTSLRGALSEKVSQLRKEVKKGQGKIIVFIDEIHTLIGSSGATESSQDIANELKAALARGEFPCIGATTENEFKKYIEQDPAIERRFTAIDVKEPSVAESIQILEGSIALYAEHHGVSYTIESIEKACQWSHQYITERKLPDKAFSVLDLAGSRAKRHNKSVVSIKEVADIISELSHVPLSVFLEDETDRLLKLEQLFESRLKGQSQAIQAVAHAIRLGVSGFYRSKPIGSFLFLGPSGVGKTELSKLIAEALFGKPEALVRVDLTEFSESHSVARLIGAPPGYVGHNEGGFLTEAVRKKPFQVILFDEFEKAHPEVRNLLLQILDEGRLTDSRGRQVRFIDTVIILTSNIGDEAHHLYGKSLLGFQSLHVNEQTAQIQSKLLHMAQQKIGHELWGRINEKIVFQPLSQQALEDIACMQFKQFADHLYQTKQMTLQLHDKAAQQLVAMVSQKQLGARPIAQAFHKYIESPLAEMLMQQQIKAHDTIYVDCSEDAALPFILKRLNHNSNLPNPTQSL